MPIPNRPNPNRALLAALCCLTIAPTVRAAEGSEADFTVGDIKVEGLQRISQGTVFNYLPVNIGDRMGPQRLREALRALYATGFFRDVEIRRDGNTLLVAVLERPSLESVDIKGNKDIKTEDLQKSLRNVGLSAGKTFNRSTLEEVTQYLTDQYYSRGKYAVKIDSKVEDLPNNRVRVNLDIKEGSRAKIRQINIVGNTVFKAKDILDTLTLKTPNITSWYKQDDRYSRESLQGDLEKIQAYYQDRGYANARTESVQVAVSPDKADVFITVNINEGVTYKIKDVKLAGNLVVPEAQLKFLLIPKAGDTFNQKSITSTQELIKNRLGAEGYFFAKVEDVKTVDEANREVSLTLYVEPGNRVYVREISFKGTTRSNDETLRRELRQLEGGLMSNIALERSKQRLEQQTFVESADFETNPVAGSPDLVDVVFNVKERPSATISGGVGYSASQKFMLNGSFQDSDFMGGGDTVGVQLDSGIYNKLYSFAHTNPYVTMDGLARTVSLSYRDSTQFVSSSSNFKSTNLALGLTYGYPITEYQRISVGASLQRVDLLTYGGASAQQAVDWVRLNGDPYRRNIISTYTYGDGTTLSNTTTLYGSRYHTVEANVGWLYEARNRGLFADRGQRHVVSFAFVPAGAVRYYVASYEGVRYFPLGKHLTLSLGANIDYANALGKTTALPPYKRFYGGGPDTVRGYTESSLGPVDSNGNPYGGNLLTAARAELILPMPQKFQTSARVTMFYDYGNVFSTDGTKYTGYDGTTAVDYKFSFGNMRRSAGLAVQWLAPQLGVFRFSYGIPLNPYKATQASIDAGNRHFADRTEYFQFTIGGSF